MRLLVNASNLHTGGGVAVASSVIDEFSRLGDEALRLSVVVSSEVARNLTALGTETGVFAEFEVFDVQGMRGLWEKLPFRRANFDVVLNIFGPVYSPIWATGSVMGFAQPWVAFPNNDAYKLLPSADRSRVRARFQLMAAWFLLAGTLVVEQEAIRVALRKRRPFRRKRIQVVESAVDSVYRDPSRWEAIELPPKSGHLRLGVVARKYLHKNLEILPEVLGILRSEYGIQAECLVTLPDSEWDASSEAFRREMTNVGPLALSQCPSFNAQLDAVVFPTLLECFSATPIEAQAVGTPLFASDLPVVRETVGDYATYFDPLNAGDIAGSIATAYRAGTLARKATSGIGRPGHSAADRARELLEICRQQASHKSGR